jgi:sulfur carrier protein
MNVLINGEMQILEPPITVAQLLTQFQLEPMRVAVEVNQQLVRRGHFAETRVREGDRIEIVTLVGGG